jgi:hypothetical protein
MAYRALAQAAWTMIHLKTTLRQEPAKESLQRLRSSTVPA